MPSQIAKKLNQQPPPKMTEASEYTRVLSLKENLGKLDVPLKKFEDPVKLFAEVLRETHPANSVVSNKLDIENAADTKYIIPVDESGEYCIVLRESARVRQIWREVEPFSMASTVVDYERRHKFNRYFSSLDDLYKLYITPPYLSPSICSEQDDWRTGSSSWLLRWRLEELRTNKKVLSELQDVAYTHRSVGLYNQLKLARQQKWEDVTLARTLACCCLSIKEGQMKIGQVLMLCYELGILEQPKQVSAEGYAIQIILVVECFHKLDEINYIGPLDFPEVPFETGCHRFNLCDFIPEALGCQIIPKILGLEVRSFFCILQITQGFEEIGEEVSGSEAVFRVDHLHLDSLREIGKLKIRWTAYVDRHLLLDAENAIVWLYWKTPRVAPQHAPIRELQALCMDISPCFGSTSPIKYCLDSFAQGLEEEISETLTIIFGAKKRFGKWMPAYSRVGKLAWLSNKALKAMRNSEHPISGWHKEAVLEENHFSYDQFPYFEHRIRKLRHYMDTQKPQSLRQLWKDKRDTLSYYTFWAVIIFGGLSIVLAFFSLAVSVAETYAAFKALDVAAQPSTA